MLGAAAAWRVGPVVDVLGDERRRSPTANSAAVSASERPQRRARALDGDRARCGAEEST